jgi:hypothetical protein
MRKAALTPLHPVLIFALVAQAACVPPAAHPAVTPASSGQLVLEEDGDVVSNGKVVSLEEVTRCNPAAHAEALRAGDSFRTSMIVSVVGLTGIVASLAALGVYGLSRTPQPSWVLGVGIGGSLGSLGVGVTGAVLSLDRRHKRNAVDLYNQGLPPCGPSPAPANSALPLSPPRPR